SCVPAAAPVQDLGQADRSTRMHPGAWGGRGGFPIELVRPFEVTVRRQVLGLVTQSGRVIVGHDLFLVVPGIGGFGRGVGGAGAGGRSGRGGHAFLGVAPPALGPGEEAPSSFCVVWAQPSALRRNRRFLYEIVTVSVGAATVWLPLTGLPHDSTFTA